MLTEANTTSARPIVLRREAFEAHIANARAAMRRRDWATAELLLDRAHVIGQPSVADHVRTHAWMLLYGWKKHDGGEIAGQIWRLLVAGPSSFLGLYPSGNTGRTNVSGFQPMEIPADLRILLEHESS